MTYQGASHKCAVFADTVTLSDLAAFDSFHSKTHARARGPCLGTCCYSSTLHCATAHPQQRSALRGMTTVQCMQSGALHCAAGCSTVKGHVCQERIPIPPIIVLHTKTKSSHTGVSIYACCGDRCNKHAMRGQWYSGRGERSCRHLGMGTVLLVRPIELL